MGLQERHIRGGMHSIQPRTGHGWTRGVGKEGGGKTKAKAAVELGAHFNMLITLFMLFLLIIRGTKENGNTVPEGKLGK